MKDIKKINQIINYPCLLSLLDKDAIFINQPFLNDTINENTEKILANLPNNTKIEIDSYLFLNDYLSYDHIVPTNYEKFHYNLFGYYPKSRYDNVIKNHIKNNPAKIVSRRLTKTEKLNFLSTDSISLAERSFTKKFNKKLAKKGLQSLQENNQKEYWQLFDKEWEKELREITYKKLNIKIKENIISILNGDFFTLKESKLMMKFIYHIAYKNLGQKVANDLKRIHKLLVLAEQKEGYYSEFTMAILYQYIFNFLKNKKIKSFIKKTIVYNNPVYYILNHNQTRLRKIAIKNNESLNHNFFHIIHIKINGQNYQLCTFGDYGYSDRNPFNIISHDLFFSENDAEKKYYMGLFLISKILESSKDVEINHNTVYTNSYNQEFCQKSNKLDYLKESAAYAHFFDKKSENLIKAFDFNSLSNSLILEIFEEKSKIIPITWAGYRKI